MCTPDGIVFDLLNIVPYLKKFKRHPVTGAPLAASDLIKLHFHKNPEGKYACPVLYKTFNQHSHIVAIKATGNVYSHEAVKELNLKAGNLRDLIDDTPFKRDEVITIQDPTDGTRREIERFSHVCENLTAKTAKDESGAAATHARLLPPAPRATIAAPRRRQPRAPRLSRSRGERRLRPSCRAPPAAPLLTRPC